MILTDSFLKQYVTVSNLLKRQCHTCIEVVDWYRFGGQGRREKEIRDVEVRHLVSNMFSLSIFYGGQQWRRLFDSEE